jgi:hypothetical protein
MKTATTATIQLVLALGLMVLPALVQAQGNPTLEGRLSPRELVTLLLIGRDRGEPAVE